MKTQKIVALLSLVSSLALFFLEGFASKSDLLQFYVVEHPFWRLFNVVVAAGLYGSYKLFTQKKAPRIFWVLSSLPIVVATWIFYKILTSI